MKRLILVASALAIATLGGCAYHRYGYGPYGDGYYGRYDDRYGDGYYNHHYRDRDGYYSDRHYDRDYDNR